MEIFGIIFINVVFFFIGMFVGVLMVALLQGNKDSDDSVDWYGQDKF